MLSTSPDPAASHAARANGAATHAALIPSPTPRARCNVRATVRPPDLAAPVRVVLADDHAMVRGGIRALLTGMGWIDVVAEAADGAELIAAVHAARPDLVLTDISMPVLDGLAALESLRRTDPGLRAIVLSMHESGEMLQRALQCGACGFLPKDAPPWELEQAIAAVMEDGRYFGTGATSQLLEPPAPSPLEQLTPRQLQILVMIARGRASKQIGFELGLSSKTVDVHRGHLMERLQLRDVASLTLFAIRMGLIDA
jgi:DNA-binding NarL/FixJ family response regulator